MCSESSDGLFYNDKSISLDCVAFRLTKVKSVSLNCYLLSKFINCFKVILQRLLKCNNPVNLYIWNDNIRIDYDLEIFKH